MIVENENRIRLISGRTSKPAGELARKRFEGSLEKELNTRVLNKEEKRAKDVRSTKEEKIGVRSSRLRRLRRHFISPLR